MASTADGQNLISPVSDCTMNCASSIFPLLDIGGKVRSPKRDSTFSSASTSTIDTDTNYVTFTSNSNDYVAYTSSPTLAAYCEPLRSSPSNSAAEQRVTFASSADCCETAAMTSSTSFPDGSSVGTKHVAFRTHSSDVVIGDEENGVTAKIVGDDKTSVEGGEYEMRQQMFYRHQAQRKSLLGKPINFPLHRRDARIRRTQATVYNFLERPKNWRSISYHLLV